MNEKGEVTKVPDMDSMKQDMFTISISDSETLETIKKVYQRHKVLLEPHGSVGWSGLQHFLAFSANDDNPSQVCVSLETAHPAKFPMEIQQILGFDPELPSSMSGLDNKEEQFIRLENNYSIFKQFLKEKYL